MDGFKVLEHFMTQLDNVVYNVNTNRQHANDSDTLDRVQDSLNRMVIDYKRSKGEDTSEQEEAFHRAIERRNHRN